MNNQFLVLGNTIYTYSELIEDINNKIEYSNYIYIKNNHPYLIFLSLLHSLLYDYKVELIDGDFSGKEMENIGLNEEVLKLKKTIDLKIKIDSIKEIFEEKSFSNWGVTLYTSGTTGLPKKVTHTFETISRNAKKGKKFSDNIWGFCYNATHMAGIQVFLQAIINQNTIIYLFDEYIKEAKKFIYKYKITNISASSTYYKNLIQYIGKKHYPTVKYITFGGEKCDNGTINEITLRFPNAKIRNIYASTEAGSLFNSNGEIFTISEKIKDLVQINKNNELLIHSSLLGTSDTFNLENGWYNTNDVVEKISQHSFKFVSRKSDLINVGGYKVNPLEVEEILLEVEGLIDILIYGMKNRVTGNIIVADIIIEDSLDKKDFKTTFFNYAKNNLQSWKIPRIINFVDEIKKTRTGKKVRK